MTGSDLWSGIRASVLDEAVAGLSPDEPDVRDALVRLLGDEERGVVRGPYLRARLPLRPVAADWQSPLTWLPAGFVPYEHQAEAFERLSVAGRLLSPTLITGSSGSGKSEAFLLPVLDHCARQRSMGRGGIKAIVVHRSPGAAQVDAARVAALCHSEARMAGVVAGLLTDDLGAATTPGPGHLVDSVHALSATPPDLLLTTQTMLDRLLRGERYRPVWAGTTPASLRFAVVDGVDDYDEGELATLRVLLRRLGATLRMATADQALSGAVPVVTATTSGQPDPEGVERLCALAADVFGVEFDPDDVVTESRQQLDELCPSADTSLPQPTVEQLAALDADDLGGVAAAVLGEDAVGLPGADPVGLGARLARHPLARACLDAMSVRRPVHEVLDALALVAPGWQDAALNDPRRAAAALDRVLTLLRAARLPVGGATVPFAWIDAHVAVREVSRLLRRLGPDPHFCWDDEEAAGAPGATALAALERRSSDRAELDLPAVHCTACGRSGWLASSAGRDGSAVVRPTGLHRPLGEQTGRLRILLRTSPTDPAATLLDLEQRRFSDEPAGTGSGRGLAVLVSEGEGAARRGTCPACRTPGAVAFVGTTSTRLASRAVELLHEAAGPVPARVLTLSASANEAALLTDDLSWRAYQRHLRAELSAVLADPAHAGGVAPAEMPGALMARAATVEARYQLVPPDLRVDPRMQTLWSHEPDAEATAQLARRLESELARAQRQPADGGVPSELPLVAASSTELMPDYQRAAVEWRFKYGDTPDSPGVVNLSARSGSGVHPSHVPGFVVHGVPSEGSAYAHLTEHVGAAIGSASVVAVVADDAAGRRTWAELDRTVCAEASAPVTHVLSPVTASDYVTYLFDRVADGTIAVPLAFHTIGQLMQVALGPEGTFRAVAAESANNPHHCAAFLELFGDRIDAASAAHLREFAERGVEPALVAAGQRWIDELRGLERHHAAVNGAVRTLSSRRERSADETDELWSLLGHLDVLGARIQRTRDEAWFEALAGWDLTGDRQHSSTASTVVELALWHVGGDRRNNLLVEHVAPGGAVSAGAVPGTPLRIDGHRRDIGAVEPVPSEEPDGDRVLVCPTCGHLQLLGHDDLPTCAHCGTATDDADGSGAVRRLVDPDRVVAIGSEVAARVAHVEPTPEALPFVARTLVTVDAESVVDAWRVPGVAHGAELCRPAQLRTVLLGARGVDGAGALSVCHWCGSVRSGATAAPARSEHLGWCGVRLGTQREQWDAAAVGEVVTAAAVRVLVPVTDLQAAARLESLRAALRLGLIEVVGDDAAVLHVDLASDPNPGGASRRHHLVVHGGVGDDELVARIADAATLRQVLLAGREVVDGCACRSTDATACSRCLLGVTEVSRHELVTAELALEVLGEILDHGGDPEPVESLDTVDLTDLERRALPAAFQLALRVWADGDPDARARLHRIDGRAGTFELSVTLEGNERRYHLEELTASTSGEGADVAGPAFVITPAEGGGTSIAVHLHRLDGDVPSRPGRSQPSTDGAAKAAALQWHLTWAEVRDFFDAMVAMAPERLDDAELLTPEARRAAEAHLERSGGAVNVDAIEQHPLALLLDVLARPDLGQWRAAVAAAVDGLRECGLDTPDASPGPSAADPEQQRVRQRARLQWVNVAQFLDTASTSGNGSGARPQVSPQR